MKRGLGLACLVGLAFALPLGSARADPANYGIESVGATASTNQAGAHPDLTVDFKLKTEPNDELPSTTRDITVDLPPGLLGNPNAALKCSAAQLSTTDVEDESGKTGCPQDSQVGIANVLVFKSTGALSLIEPIYNMDAPGGDTVARLGFIADVYPVLINVHLRSENDYGVSVTVEGASSLIPLLSSETTIWGVPAAESHDTQRITAYESVHCNGVPCTAPGGVSRPSNLTPAPFLVNPTSCGGEREIVVTATSYGNPGNPSTKKTFLPPVAGCGQLGFEPTLTALPTTRATSSPSGLDVNLDLPQDESVGSVATSQIRDARVALPEGMTISPGVADGLAACDAAEAGYKSRQPSRCPETAKLATAEIDVPALARPLQGAVYQRTPEAGNLFRIWLIADDLGAHIALPGELEVNRQTGQITSMFVDLPQAPVRNLKLHFFRGSKGPLATPATCGTYFTNYEFTPWSGNAPAKGEAPAPIDQDCAEPGFGPRLSGGSINPLAGAFSSFVTRLTREANEQNVVGLDVELPPGLLAKTAGVQLCEGAAATSGQCPPGSRIGGTIIAAGPGATPLWIPQPGKEPTALYLSGPYRGAPYSLIVTTPAQAGPFDLGTVVTRAGIYVDPRTARVTVRSDPLPQIIEGVPVSYRTVQVNVDRVGFTLNPTNCKRFSLAAHITSAQGATADPSAGFQVAGCAALAFKPGLSMKLFGKTNRGGHPRFRAVLKARRGDANIARAQVALPRSEFLENAHISTICTRVQFAAKECPAGSVYGHAEVRTPLLSEPLKGSVYLRSSNHELPDLVVALHGQVDFNLVGRIDSVNGGIRTTFTSVPDAPVSKFVLTMQGGKKGLLVNSRNLCLAPTHATVEFDAQNGRVVNQSPVLHNDCSRNR